VPDNITIEWLLEKIDPNVTEANKPFMQLGILSFYSGRILEQGIEMAGTLDVGFFFSLFVSFLLIFCLFLQQDAIFEKIRTSSFDTSIGRFQWDASRLQERKMIVYQNVIDPQTGEAKRHYIGPLRLSNREGNRLPLSISLSLFLLFFFC